MNVGIQATGRKLFVGFFLLLATVTTHAEEGVVLGAEDDWAPFSSVKDGEPVGMAVEIVQAIFAEAGIPLRLVSLPYARCMNETMAGRVTGCFDTVPDANLRKNYLFHAKPLFSLAAYIVAPSASKDAGLKTADLRGKNVVVPTGYNYGDEFESDKLIRRQNVLSDINALRMVAAKRADYTLVYEGVLEHLLRGPAASVKDQIRIVGEIRQKNELYISFSQKAPAAEQLLKRFNDAHARLIANGGIAAIRKRWH